MEKIDILLPIYNSVSNVKDCIDSILKNTPTDIFNLLLLDDHSSDNKIKDLTKCYSEEYENVQLYRNKVNLGFPSNINNGFRKSKNDVVILNSDTIVSEHWLEALQKVADSDKRIAAVNPMSNYGIISGLPTNNNQLNNIFSYSEIVCSLKKIDRKLGFIYSPLLIGFCMYIKRAAIEKVGLFDSETFKKGYGEETDWCMRARKLGFNLAVSKDAYVHHAGGMSYGIEKQRLQQQSRIILIKKYPEIDKELKKYVRSNLLNDVRKQTMRGLKISNKKISLKLMCKYLKHYLINTF